MDIDVHGTPYYLANKNAAAQIRSTIIELSNRVETLRSQGKLNESTLRDYYGEKRFEQIAESNAIEGSTLSVGETELAVLKGITISGHDPGFSRDAQSLAKALDELTVLAQLRNATDIDQVKQLHELILGDRGGAGEFRSTEVRIRGSKHVPPKTWREVMESMEHWEKWSLQHSAAPVILRAAVLHAWLEHIHPFVDGNGRTGRAITNLELVRAGYPPIIIRKKDRDRYLDALSRADEGDLSSFLEIIVGRIEDALRDLERSAQRRMGYDRRREQLKIAQANRLAVWNAGVHLLCASIRSLLQDHIENLGLEFEIREFDQLSVDDFIELCEGRTVRLSWAFLIRCRAPGMAMVERLAWAGVANPKVRSELAGQPGRPVLMWSVPNPNRYPPWIQAGSDAFVGEQMTIVHDRWLVTGPREASLYSPSELAEKIAEAIIDAATRHDSF